MEAIRTSRPHVSARPHVRTLMLALVFVSAIVLSFAGGRSSAPTIVLPGAPAKVAPATTPVDISATIPDHGRVKWVTWD